MAIQQKQSCLIVALNVADDGSVPEWVQVLPSGEIITGHDGRQWRNNPDGVVAAFNQRGRPLLIDWEHASEHRAPQGLDAPASGWLNAMEVRNGEVWGQVEWTERAANQIRNREYRFLSPVILYSPKTRRIARVDSLGLTNKPNFSLKALNREQTEESPMTLSDALRKALNLADDATEVQAVTAIQALENKARAANTLQEHPTPDLTKFVPRADYDQLKERAANAEQKLKTLQQEQSDAAMDELINQGVKDGKIAPSSVEFFKASCRQEDGLEKLRKYLESAPKLVSDSGLDDKNPDDASRSMNTETTQVSRMFGNSVEDLKKYGGLE